MAHFSIFIPEKQGVCEAHLKQVGLGELIQDGDVAPESFDVTSGPSDTKGLMVVWRTSNETNAEVMNPDSYDWEEEPDGKWWLGRLKREPVTPKDLQRTNFMLGHDITMADGHTWTIPSIQNVPQHIKIGSDGGIQTEPRKEYRWYYDAGMKLATEIFEQLGVQAYLNDLEDKSKVEGLDYTARFTIKGGLEVIAYGFSLNYRVNLKILSMLNCFDEDCLMHAIAAVINYPQIVETETQKKNVEHVTLRITPRMCNG